MPVYKEIDEGFFDKWTPENAYTLGLLVADGTVTTNPRGSAYVEFVSTDKELICDFKRMIRSSHKISSRQRSSRWKEIYRIQIGSKRLIERLKELGLSGTREFFHKKQSIPREYFAHFVRGFFDGDGCVRKGRYYSCERSKDRPYFQVVFTSKYEDFLRGLCDKLKKYAGLKGGSLCRGTRCYRLSFARNDGYKLYKYLYCNKEEGMYLKRKYWIFKKEFGE